MRITTSYPQPALELITVRHGCTRAKERGKAAPQLANRLFAISKFMDRVVDTWWRYPNRDITRKLHKSDIVRFLPVAGDKMGRILNRVKQSNLRFQKFIWRAVHKPNQKVAVFILGVQRSGTTVLIDTLNKLAACETYGESHPAAMQDFRLRSVDTVRELVGKSAHELVVFKPLIDSHLARELLSLWPNSKVIWVFRRVENVVASNYIKFGDNNLQLIRSYLAGDENWLANGLSEESIDYLRSFDYDGVTPQTGCALLWYVRNRMYFEMGLDNLTEVLPVAYEEFVAQPNEVLQSICEFVGTQFSPRMSRGIGVRSNSVDVEIPDELRSRCHALYDQIASSRVERFQAG